MKQYHLLVKPSAEQDIVERYQQIKEASEQNALKWYLAIMDSIESLSQLAVLCPIAPESDYIEVEIRHLVIGDYRVLFYIESDNVHILHIRHSAMKRSHTIKNS